jgi:hypothetical protein
MDSKSKFYKKDDSNDDDDDCDEKEFDDMIAE